MFNLSTGFAGTFKFKLDSVIIIDEPDETQHKMGEAITFRWYEMKLDAKQSNPDLLFIWYIMKNLAAYIANCLCKPRWQR